MQMVCYSGYNVTYIHYVHVIAISGMSQKLTENNALMATDSNMIACECLINILHYCIMH